jgi:hypothetical protein
MMLPYLVQNHVALVSTTLLTRFCCHVSLAGTTSHRILFFRFPVDLLLFPESVREEDQERPSRSSIAGTVADLQLSC